MRIIVIYKRVAAKEAHYETSCLKLAYFLNSVTEMIRPLYPVAKIGDPFWYPKRFKRLATVEHIGQIYAA